MKAKDAIRKIMELGKISSAKLGRNLGDSPQKVWNTLNDYNGKGMSVETLVRYAAALDYKLVLMPNERGNERIVIDE